MAIKSVLLLLLYCRPDQHGEDMLAPMSAILNDYSEQHHSAAVCHVLHGLRALCEAEVVSLVMHFDKKNIGCSPPSLNVVVLLGRVMVRVRPHSPSQMASRSNWPFCHSTLSRPTDRHTHTDWQMG